MSEVVDLDVFEPQSLTIKFKGDEIQVQPPTVINLLRLGAAASKLGDITKLSDEEVEKALTDIHVVIYKIIPQLDGQQLNLAQLQNLTGKITSMAMPEEAKALESEGITQDTIKKDQ